jgi:hypothetical protein
MGKIVSADQTVGFNPLLENLFQHPLRPILPAASLLHESKTGGQNILPVLDSGGIEKRAKSLPARGEGFSVGLV